MSEQVAPGDDGVPHSESAGADWQRFHPLTPLLRGGVIALGAIGYFLSSQANRIFGADPEDPTGGHWLIGGAIFAAVLIAVVVGSWVAWRASSYRLGGATVELRTGVIDKKHRQVRYDRIQAVDLRRPLLAQLFGLSAVRVEAAGGADSNAELAYLAQGRAEELREELLARARAADGTAPPPVPGAVEGAPALPDGGGAARLIAAIPAARVYLATALSPGSFFLILALPTLIWILISGNLGFLPILGPAILGAIGPQFSRLSSWMNFRVEALPGAIRVRHGLTEVRTSTIPLHRIQAVEISQPALWRGLEWWRLRVNVAGVNEEPGSEQDALIPVGTREEVLRILLEMGPRWSLPEVIEGLDAPGPSPHFVPVPPSARWLDPLSWKRIGYAVTPTALITRGGWLGRSVSLVPYARVQSIVVDRGPLERRLGLANVRLISTVGSVDPTARHVDLATANELMNDVSARSRAARSVESAPGSVNPMPTDRPEQAPSALSSRPEGPHSPAGPVGEQDGARA